MQNATAPALVWETPWRLYLCLSTKSPGATLPSVGRGRGRGASFPSLGRGRGKVSRKPKNEQRKPIPRKLNVAMPIQWNFAGTHRRHRGQNVKGADVCSAPRHPRKQYGTTREGCITRTGRPRCARRRPGSSLRNHRLAPPILAAAAGAHAPPVTPPVGKTEGMCQEVVPPVPSGRFDTCATSAGN